ncbi:MAG: type III-B CRISPR module RAMP protein Cmr1 [Clostridia bacterium]|nr:type III-B CRISPR module RAMP protein Cmr1 [Clostridia bacterium]
MPNLSIKTPIWIGNIDMKSDTLQLTGIMGSLRWWFEVILRGLGKYVCDPTSNEKCPENVNKKDSYCPACLIFGATGIRRMFRLFADGGEKVFDGGQINIKPGNRGWFLGSGLKGDLKIYITALDRGYDESLILTPLIVASKWGGFGGKTQLGYGVIEIEDIHKMDVVKFKEAVEKIILEKPSKLNVNLRNGSLKGLPNINDMFFAKVQFETDSEDWWKNVEVLKDKINDDRLKNWVKSGSVPIAPAIKYWLRYGSKLVLNNKRIDNFLFGTVIREPIASKINVSCAYKAGENIWEFRIWGWIPKDNLLKGFNREKFLNGLKNSLEGHGSPSIPWDKLFGLHNTKNHQLKVWREFFSLRDTVKPGENNVEEYLQSLLSGEGDENDV